MVSVYYLEKEIMDLDEISNMKRHSQQAFYVNLHRAVIGPSATLTGRWRPDIDLRRMLTGLTISCLGLLIGILRRFSIVIVPSKRKEKWFPLNILRKDWWILDGISYIYDIANILFGIITSIFRQFSIELLPMLSDNNGLCLRKK